MARPGSYITGFEDTTLYTTPIPKQGVLLVGVLIVRALLIGGGFQELEAPFWESP